MSYSRFATTIITNIVGKDSLPSNVGNFTGDIHSDVGGILLSWNAISDVDFLAYIIQYRYSLIELTATWEDVLSDNTKVFEGLNTKFLYTASSLPVVGYHYFFIKAITTADKYSTVATSVTVPIVADSWTIETIQTTVESATVSFYQDAPPTGAKTGDIWFDTDSSPVNKQYVYTGEDWKAIEGNKGDPGIGHTTTYIDFQTVEDDAFANNSRWKIFDDEESNPSSDGDVGWSIDTKRIYLSTIGENGDNSSYFDSLTIGDKGRFITDNAAVVANLPDFCDITTVCDESLICDSPAGSVVYTLLGIPERVNVSGDDDSEGTVYRFKIEINRVDTMTLDPDNEHIAAFGWSKAERGIQGDPPVLERQYSDDAGLLSEMGDPNTPGYVWIAGSQIDVSWYINDEDDPPDTAFWIAERFISKGVISDWQLTPVQAKDGGIPFVSFDITLDTNEDAPGLNDAEWNTNAIEAVTAFTGRTYSTALEFGYGTVVLINYAITNIIEDATCDYDNDPTIEHYTNTNIKVGMQVTGAGIPSGSTVFNVTDNDVFELSVATTGGPHTDETLVFTEYVVEKVIGKLTIDGWVAPGTFIDGDLFVDGSIAARHMQANSISTTSLQVGAATVDKILVNGKLTISETTGSFNFKKTAYDDFSTAGIFIGNENESGSNVPVFLAGIGTSYIRIDDEGVILVNPKIFIDGSTSNTTLTSDGLPPVFAGGTFDFDAPGDYEVDIFSNYDKITFELSGGGGGGGGAISFGPGTGGVGQNGYDTIIEIIPESGAVTTFTASGGDGGANNSGNTIGESFNIYGENDLFYGIGGTGNQNPPDAGSQGTDAVGISAGGGGGSDDSGASSAKLAHGGKAGSFVREPNFETFNSTDTIKITVGKGGAGGTGIGGASVGPGSGGAGVNGAVRLIITVLEL